MKKTSEIKNNSEYSFNVEQLYEKNELNYDKLSEAIVLALIKYNSIENVKEETTLIPDENKDTTEQGSATFTLLQFITCGILLLISIIMATATFTIASTTIDYWNKMNCGQVFFCACLDLLSLLITIICFKSTVETYKTNNIKLINTVFNAIIAFAALIIATIQLIRG